jgi:hypothetical protein
LPRVTPGRRMPAVAPSFGVRSCEPC